MAELALLTSCDATQAEQFLHAVADAIVNRKQPRLTDYGKTWTVGDWRTLVTAYTSLLTSAAQSSSFSIEKQLQDAGVTGDYVAVAKACFEARQEELRKALLEQVAAIGSAHLVDYDWKVKLAMSSDSIADLQQPLVQVSLKVAQPNGTVKTIMMEMTRPELQEFIASLEKANTVVQELKA